MIRMIETLQTITKENEMEINVKKTFMMANAKDNYVFTIFGNSVETVNQKKISI